ncbi:MAG: hypothetical protein DDG59_02035 [Anaerolineae bacterium]|nr:MAG: hypothetical protein DDG59_02035 [Anaerolineae bacterium]
MCMSWFIAFYSIHLAHSPKASIMSGMFGFIRKVRSNPQILKLTLIIAVGFLSIAFILISPEGLLGKADALGYAVCHRIDLRSFHLGDRPLPLCARCTGMYLGALLGLVFQFWVGKRCSGTPPRRVIVVFVLLGLAFALDGVNSYLTLFPGLPHLYTPQNALRLATGSGMGLTIAALLYPSFQQTIWSEVRETAALQNLRQLFGLIFLAGVVNGLVLTQNPLILYPFALLSASGVLVLLTMVYTMLWVIVLRRENSFARWHELRMFLLVGFGFSLLQIFLIDIGRFLLTGTWDGFKIG